MLNVFDSLLSVLQMAGDYIMNLVTGIGSFIAMIPQSLTFVDVAMDAMPGVLKIYALAGLMICLVFMIIGR